MEKNNLVKQLEWKTFMKQIIEKKTSDSLFDLTKPVPNEVVIGTFSSVFAISVAIVVWINMYAKKKWIKWIKHNYI